MATAGGENGTTRAIDMPSRTCAVTRREHPPDELLRFVLGPDGTIVPDVARKLPGRGVWVTCDRGIVATAAKANAFARGFRRPVSVPAGLPDLIDGLLCRRALAALSLANKAGLVTAGFAKIEARIDRGRIIALVHGADAAVDGAQKLDRKLAAVGHADGRTPAVVREFSIEQLSLAIGRPNVVHAGLSSGGATASFLGDARRVARYRAALHPLSEAAVAG